MRRNVVWAGLTVTASIAVLVALPVPAGAVLSGTNGRIVLASGRNEASDSTAKLYLRTAFGGTGGGSAGATVTPATLVQHRHPTWSPDRTKIAYAAGDNATANYDIFILNLTAPVAVPLNITNSPNVTDDRPAWSPDGTRIAFDSENADASNQLNIKIYNVGTGDTNNFTSINAGTYEHKPAWTPDSQTLFYGTGSFQVAGALDIVRQPADGSAAASNVAAAAGISEFQPSISPDGTQMCFTLGDLGSGAARVRTSLANGGGQMELPGTLGVASYNCTWSPDGTKIAYVQGVFSGGDLVMENSDLSLNLISLETTLNRFDGNPDWAPDGRPTCQDATVSVVVNTPTSIPLACADSGPQYEQTPIIVDTPADAAPANGALGAVQQGSPASVTYTPNANFTGTDTFQARVRDGVAFGTQRGTITLKVAPPGANDTVAPSFAGRVRADPRTFEVNRTGKRETAVSAAKGTTFRYSLSEAATVTFRIERKTTGRRVNGKCRKATRQNRARRKCTLYTRVGAFRSAAVSGKNGKRFSGRIGRRNLSRSSHRAVLTATDAAGNRSKQARAAFRVVAAKRAR